MKAKSTKHLVDGKYSIKDLVDLDELRALFQGFTDAMGFTIGFLSTPKLEILIATGWRKICTQYHRSCPLAIERCRISNARLVRHVERPGQIIIEACENGLVDCATPIIIKGKKVAILATGQVLLKPPNIEHFKKQAKLYGCNEAAYLRALKDVPVISPKKLKQATRFLGKLAHTVIKMGYAGLEEKERSELLSREIHKRKEMEEDLRVKNRVFDASIAAMSITDNKGIITETNDAFLRVWGYRSKKEVLGKPVSHFLEDRNNAAAILRALNRKGEWKGEYLAKKKDGSTFIASSLATVVRNNGGQLIGYQSAVIDITGRRLGEDREREAAQRLKAVFDSTFQFIALLKPNGKVLEVNQSALKFGGLTPQDVRDEFFWNCQWWTISKAIQRQVRKAIARAGRGEFVRYPVEVLGKKGAVIAIDFSLKSVKDKNGKVILLTAEGRDITERKQVEDALLASEEQYRNIFESSQDALMTLESPSWKFTSANTAMLRMFGAKNCAELFSCSPWILSPKWQPDGTLSSKKAKKMIGVAVQKGSHFFEWVFRRIDGTTFSSEVLLTKVIKDKDKDKDKDIVSLQATVRDITARKKSEETLRESEEKFRLMFNTAAAGMAMCNMDGSLVEVNQAYLDIIGYTRKEALSLSYWDLTPKKYAKDEARQLRSMELTGKYGPYTKKYIRKTGERVDVMLTGAVVTGADGVKRIWSIVENITERKKNEHNILASEMRYRRLFESAKDGILILNAETGVIDEVNPYLIELLGYSHKVFLRKKLWEIGFFKNIVQNRTHFRELQQKKYIRYADIPLAIADGRRINVEFISNVYRVDNQRVIQCNIRDVTDQRNAEQAVRESEARLRFATEGIDAGEWDLDLLTHEAYRSVQHDRIFGYKKLLPKWTYQMFLKHVVPEDRKLVNEKFYRSLAEKRNWDFECRIMRKDKILRWIRACGRPCQYEKGKPRRIVGVVQDVTERKRAEEMLKQREAYLTAIVDNQSGMVWLKDKDSRFLAVNQVFAKMAGKKKPEDVVGKTDLDFWPPKMAKGYRADDRRVMRSHKPVSVEELIFEKGVARWHETFKTPVFDSDGKVIGTTGYARDITERRQAEEALRESEERFRKIVEQAPMAMAIVSLKGVIEYINQKAVEVFGYLPKDIPTMKKWWVRAYPEKAYRRKSSADWERRVRRAVAKGPEIQGAEYRVTCKDRTVKTIFISGAHISRKIFVLFEDITDRKKTEDELAFQKKFLAETLENIDAGVVACDAEGKLVLFNRVARKWHGLDPQDIPSEEWAHHYSLYKEDGTTPLNAQTVPLSRGFCGETVRDVGMVIAARGQPKRDVIAYAGPVKGKGGKILGAVAVMHDITERKKAEEALREHRHQLLQIIDTVPHMIFAKDRKGRFLLVNRAVAEAYQTTPKALIGVRRQDVHKNRQELEGFLKGDRAVLASLKPWLVANESFTDSRGQKNILQTIKIPFKMIGVKDVCILGVSVDVTEQKKVEEFRNDIVRTVSHELRTPLSIEKEGISLLMDGMVGAVNVEQREVLETVMRSIDRLGRMITSLLDISIIETGKIRLLEKMTNLIDLVKDVAFEFKKRASEKGIDLNVKMPGRAVQVLADPDKIMQVLSNLVDNAIKFTPLGGAVEISTNVLKNAVECEVRDTGIGIAPSNTGKLFEKFQQFSRAAGPGEKGFGLGLSIAKGIVELHGGRIWVKSELGKGTRATFSLPLYQRKED